MTRINIIWSILGLNSILFVALILSLGSLQIPTADDLIYLKWAEELGIWDSTMLLRKEWNTRWMAILLNQSYLTVIPKPVLGLIYQSTTLALGLLAFYPTSKFLIPNSSVLKRILLSLSLLLTLFFLSFGLSDSWFWMCSQPTYLWATLMSVWMIATLFKTKRSLFLFPMIIAAHIYVGGSSEIIVICLLLIELSLFLFRNRIPLINKKLLIVGLICLTGSLVFSLSGEGIENRYAHLSPPGIIDGSIIAFKSYLKTLIYGIGLKLPVIGITIIILLAITSNKTIRPFFDWKIPFGIADGVLICTMVITALTLGDIGPNRALIHISMMILALVILLIPLIRPPLLNDKHLQFTAIGFSIIVTGFLIHALIIDLPKEQSYSAALSERQLTIKSQISFGSKEIHLEPLPDSKFLYRAEISADPTSENNRQLSTIYGDGIQFKLIIPD